MRSMGIAAAGLLMLASPTPLMGLPDATNRTEGITMSGTGQTAGGETFAIVRVLGLTGTRVVKAGDVLPVSTPEGSWQVRIVSIAKDSLEVETFDLVPREPAPQKPPEPPPKDDTPPRRKYDARDPFWPPGFDPNAV